MRYLIILGFLWVIVPESSFANPSAFDQQINAQIKGRLEWRIVQLKQYKEKLPTNQRAAVDRQIQQLENEIKSLNVQR